MSGILTHAWFGGLFADTEIAEILSPAADLARYRDIEIAWTMALADVGNADLSICNHAAEHIATCKISDDTLRAGVIQDGLPIPAFVSALKANAPKTAKQVIHFGLTSQDVMDTSMMLALKSILGLYRARLTRLADQLDACARANAANTLMGYTRMQAALPITAEGRITTWVRPLRGYISDIDRMAQKLDVLQWGGPVGIRETHPADALGPAFAARLGLRDPEFAWHTTRSDIAKLGGLIARITGSLGKMGQDIALMAQRGAGDITLNTGGTSSAMPHKQNPILAELLVTIAGFTAQQSATLNAAMVHEQERSGTAWVLEFMTLPDIAQLCGTAMVLAQTLIGQVVSVGVKGSDA
ncbi:MAG: lyase family protein [Octadecabacter sp.]|nr:lyase family protein [Octadecabacter sp.]